MEVEPCPFVDNGLCDVPPCSSCLMYKCPENPWNRRVDSEVD